MRKSPHIFYSCVSVSYQLEGPPPCSCPPASSRGRRRRLCTTPTHKHNYQMRRQEGQEHYRDLLQEYRKKKRKRVKSSRNITKKTEEKRVLKKKKKTWFALESQDSFDPCLVLGAKTSISIHQPDVVSSFGFLGRREEASQADSSVILIWIRDNT